MKVICKFMTFFLNIYFKFSNFRTLTDIFKVSYYICKSKDFMFVIKTDIESITLVRVILVTTDGFHYPIEESIQVERGEHFFLVLCEFS